MTEAQRRHNIAMGHKLIKWRGHWPQIVAAAELNADLSKYQEWERGYPIPADVLARVAKDGF